MCNWILSLIISPLFSHIKSSFIYICINLLSMEYFSFVKLLCMYFGIQYNNLFLCSPTLIPHDLNLTHSINFFFGGYYFKKYSRVQYTSSRNVPQFKHVTIFFPFIYASFFHYLSIDLNT